MKGGINMNKKIISAVLTMAMCISASAAFAETTIAPATAAIDSNIGNLNIFQNIHSYNYGNGAQTDNTTIAPTAILNDADSNIVNIVQTVVDVNVNVDMSDMQSTIAGIRQDIFNKMRK